MVSYKRWGCPNCKQISSRRWNMQVHIERAHGIGEPMKREKLAQEGMYGIFGPYETKGDNYRFNRSVTGTNSPSRTRATTNRTSKRHKIWLDNDIIDQQYQMALELEENRSKIKKIQEVFGEIPFAARQRFSAELFNFSPRITSNPPIPHAETPYQKKYNISTSVKSNTVNDSAVREITESSKTTQEKPKKMTFDEYRKIRPEVTFDEYRKIARTPVTDWEPVPSGKMRVKRNAFGEEVGFLILRKCGFYM
jgi:hypothetical protein